MAEYEQAVLQSLDAILKFESLKIETNEINAGFFIKFR